MDEKNESPTVVVFRKWSSGEILALFPYEHEQGYMVLSYVHVGQHGAADYGLCMRTTKAAAPEEYAGLKKELENRGYVLVVRKRASHRLIAESRRT